MSSAAAWSSGVYHEMCAVSRTFGCAYSQWPCGQRLGVDGVERRHRDPAVVERDAQRVLVDERAARDVHEVHARLHLREHVGVDEMLRLARVAGAASTRWSAPATSSSIERTTCTPVDRARRVGAAQRLHVHVERERAARDRGADPAEADERERAALDRGRARASGSSSTSAARAATSRGMRLAHASIAAITHSEIGSALAPRAHVTIRPSSNTAGATLSTPVPESCTHRTPAASSQRAISSQPEVAAEEHVGREARRRIAAGELDELDVGIRVADADGLGRRHHLVEQSSRTTAEA